MAKRRVRRAANRIEGSLDAKFHVLSSVLIGIACGDPGDAACTLTEQLALDSARGSSDAVPIMQGKIGDRRYPETVWGKFAYNYEPFFGPNIEVHFWRNLQTGDEHGFKIVRRR